MRHGLGSEHPLCDKIQALMLVLFFVVWVTDSIGFFLFGYSTIISYALVSPLLLVATILFLCLSVYLISKSHKAVFEQKYDPPELVDSGVYALVRHPMYLGTLLFCLAFIFISISFASLIVWIVFFIFYDRMATFEEKSLIKILGESYTDYKKRVSKWIPKLF